MLCVINVLFCLLSIINNDCIDDSPTMYCTNIVYLRVGLSYDLWDGVKMQPKCKHINYLGIVL